MLAWLVWTLPMAGAMLTPLFARVGHKVRDYAAVGFALLSAVAATSLLPVLLSGRVVDSQVPWFLGLDAGVLADPLSILVGTAVSWVCLLIMIYSLDYMRGDESLSRYWFFMNLFIGSMQLIIFSDNLLQLFFGWEGVGLCSYALIGFWYTDEKSRWVGTEGDTALGQPQAYSPTHAGMKAFITTRIGDVFTLIGIFIIYAYSGTFQYLKLSANTSWATALHASGLLLPAMLLLLGGAIGKSAQFPLHEWLPDAMAGPTSVSALIHAATMVKAGVYFVARLAPIFFILPFAEKGDFFTAVALIGGITAFMAASQALVNKELKKVLAYSTISQIGYMMLAIGVAGLSSNFIEGYVSSIFHLLSHMLFKAGLFMAAGVLIHVTETKYLDHMGGLRTPLKRTFYAFTILALALAGMPPLSGFWSKDAIFASALSAQSFVPDLVYVLASISALLTAFYSIRMVGLAFFGHGKGESEHLHDAGLREFSTYGILAAATLAIGFVGPLFENSLFSALSSYIAAFGVIESGSFAVNYAAVATSLAVFLLGALLAYPFYISGRASPVKVVARSSLLQGVYRFLWHRWYLDAIYYRVFVNPVRSASLWGYRVVELGFFDRLNGGVALGARSLSSAGDWFDRHVVDALVNAIGRVAGGASVRLRRLQTGVAESYLFFILVGLVLLLILLSFFTGGIP
jgi:NADH-quinone oxidoreductase subunit L